MALAEMPLQTMRPVESEWRKVWRVTVDSPLSLVGFVVVGLVIVVALLAPWLVPYPEHAGPSENLTARLQSPSAEYWLGTDWLGRDQFSRILMGARISLGIGFTVTLMAMCIGVPIGLLAGYSGGRVDEFLMRTVDVFLAFPTLVLAVLVASAWGPSINHTMVAIAITWWPKYARLMRGQTLAIKGLPFVEAAVVASASRSRVLFRHILPNGLSPLTVQGSLDTGYMILVAASLSFVGLGAQPPSPEWGLMISLGRKYMPEFWWISVFPGLAILITVLGLNLVGDGLRDALDPRTRRVRG